MKHPINHLLVASIATTQLAAHTTATSAKSNKNVTYSDESTGKSTSLFQQPPSTVSLPKSGKAVDTTTSSGKQGKGGKGSQDEVHLAEDNQSMSLSLKSQASSSSQTAKSSKLFGKAFKGKGSKSTTSASVESTGGQVTESPTTFPSAVPSLQSSVAQVVTGSEFNLPELMYIIQSFLTCEYYVWAFHRANHGRISV